MKNIYLLSILVTILVTSCRSGLQSSELPELSVNPYSTSQLIEHDTQGIVTLLGSSDEFRVKQDAIDNAQKKAIRHLLYIGFPGTDMKNPMIKKGKRVETENKAFFDQFYKSGYKQYITSNQVEYFDCEDAIKQCITAASTFKLNYNLLRRDLERNKILNKIGF
ncbi:hypothetical protein [Corallibacter sp.]|uniref:hypothetical protein n=1 Tax=Corallibacter sp. TaxID=2038084 RepID=UPI003AB1B6FE